MRRVLVLLLASVIAGCASQRPQLAGPSSSLNELLLTVKLAPEDVDARVKLGAAYARLGQYRAAVAQLDSVLSRFPDYPPALYEKGHALRALGLTAEGKRLIHRAVTSAQGGELLARLARELGRPYHVEQLTSGRHDHAFPAWFPDGRRIVLQSNRTGNWELFVLEVESRQLSQLTDHPARDEGPTVCRGGQLLAFTSTRDSEISRDVQLPPREIYLYNLESRELRRLTRSPGDDFHPVLSPDCARLFYVSAPANGECTRRVISLDLRDLGSHPITELNADCYAPEVSPDGACLLFVREEAGRSLLCELHLKSRRVRVVADTLGSKASPSYSPDGRSIVFVAKSEANYDLYLIGRDGKGLTQLTNDAAVEGQPRFSPDGKSIVFHSNRTRHFQLYLMDLTRTPAMGELEDFFK